MNPTPERQVFIKTVRSDGRSIYARGPLARTYEIGKRYTFPRQLPAHVGGRLADERNLFEAYRYRPEYPAGSRALLCFGVCQRREVPVIPVDEAVWAQDDFGWHRASRKTCTDFEVIGEIFMPNEQRDGEGLALHLDSIEPIDVSTIPVA